MAYGSSPNDNTQVLQDIVFVELAVSDLKKYLFSDLIFWPLIPSSLGNEKPGTEPAQTRLTLGNLLLVLKRLKSHIHHGRLNNQEEIKIAALEVQLGALRKSWQTAWEQKALQEFKARLNQWLHSIEELVEDRANHATYYATEVRVRVIMELLHTHLPNEKADAQEAMAQLEKLDNTLLEFFEVGDFVWDKKIQRGFLKEQYWYLYGKPVDI